MNRKIANTISDQAMGCLRNADPKLYPMLKGFDIERDRGSFGTNDLTLKVRFASKISQEQANELRDTVTNDQLRFGLAPAGTPITSGDHKGVIIKARTKKYLVRMADGDYLVRFESCKVDRREKAEVH